MARKLTHTCSSISSRFGYLFLLTNSRFRLTGMLLSEYAHLLTYYVA